MYLFDPKQTPPKRRGLADFDPTRSLIRVRRTASDVAGRIIVGPPKTAKSIRTVVLPRTITEQLAQHCTRQDQTGPQAWMFPAPEGGPIRRTTWMRRVWKPALRAAGLDPNLGTHTLRRSQVVGLPCILVSVGHGECSCV